MFIRAFKLLNLFFKGNLYFTPFNIEPVLKVINHFEKIDDLYLHNKLQFMRLV